MVHLLRHGEVYNPEKILYGRLPGYRLSDRGVRMAEVAAAAVADRDIT
ncbi:MAG: histidine phosphatase family protein, partial [Actinocatenispora sp.]